jgi:Na+-translocating ferredoxin:NAD+ oxidoreductase RnfD subunit
LGKSRGYSEIINNANSIIFGYLYVSVQVLIPLIGPYPDRIDFAVTAFNARDCLTDCANDFNRCKSKCYRERGHAHWLQFMAETTHVSKKIK